jgi:hyperosmotically inducible protein
MFQRQLLVFFSFPLLLCFACSKTNDATITTDIQAKMFADPLLKTASIAVSAKDGIVTLSGQVPSDAARATARNIASQTPGVRRVIDSTSTAPATPPAPPADASAQNLPSPPAEGKPPREKRSSQKKPAAEPPAPVSASRTRFRPGGVPSSSNSSGARYYSTSARPSATRHGHRS